MSGGFEVVEWLRPLVETNDWDYAVAWKFGVDPTRYCSNRTRFSSSLINHHYSFIHILTLFLNSCVDLLSGLVAVVEGVTRKTWSML